MAALPWLEYFHLEVPCNVRHRSYWQLRSRYGRAEELDPEFAKSVIFKLEPEFEGFS